MQRIKFLPLKKYRQQLLIQNEFMESMLALEDTYMQIKDYMKISLKNLQNQINQKMDFFLKNLKQLSTKFIKQTHTSITESLDKFYISEYKDNLKFLSKNLEDIKVKNSTLAQVLEEETSREPIFKILEDFELLKKVFFPEIRKSEIRRLKLLDNQNQRGLKAIKYIEETENLTSREELEIPSLRHSHKNSSINFSS